MRTFNSLYCLELISFHYYPQKNVLKIDLRGVSKKINFALVFASRKINFSRIYALIESPTSGKIQEECSLLMRSIQIRNGPKNRYGNTQYC